VVAAGSGATVIYRSRREMAMGGSRWQSYRFMGESENARRLTDCLMIALSKARTGGTRSLSAFPASACASTTWRSSPVRRCSPRCGRTRHQRRVDGLAAEVGPFAG